MLRGGSRQDLGCGSGDQGGADSEAELRHGKLVTEAHEETEPLSRRIWNPGLGEVGMGQGQPPETGIRPAEVRVSTTLARLLSSSPDSSIITRILAGCTTGAMAVTCAQPTDVVKIRFQASMHTGPGGNRKYSGTMDAYRTIAREEGVQGLWKGRSGLQAWGSWQRLLHPRAGTGN